ncbi:hypothetical protein HYW21_04945 [Candidatus Woesearchaeota archaeon]|nr:hypothetical protein [Candidatus Woesearchaeota archaeon]
MGLLHKGKQIISERNESLTPPLIPPTVPSMLHQKAVGETTVHQKKHKIQTRLDDLYTLVQEQKAVSLEQASVALQCPPQIIEEWAALLDKAGLMTLTYPPFGQPSLQVKEHHDKKTR